MNIVKLIKNMFKIAKLMSVDDSGDFQFATVSTLGKTQKVLMLKPYGLMSNPPSSSMVALWNQQGQESNGIGIADDPKNRILKDMAEGEVGLGNYITGDYIYFDENGDAIMFAANDVSMGALNDIALFAANDIALFALSGKCSITAPTVELIASTAMTQDAPTITQTASTSITHTAPAITQAASATITHTAPTIAMNGTSNNLVMYTQLKAQLDSLVAQYNIHWHDGTNSTKVPEVQQTLTLIAGAKANSLKTDG
jgi:phage gp45-like